MKKYEYKIFLAETQNSQMVRDGHKKLTKYLNELGNKGWELVSTIVLDVSNRRVQYTLKKEVTK